MDEHDWSQRGLAKALAERTGNLLASEISTVRSYLQPKDGARPKPERARLIAEIIGDESLAEVDGRRTARTAVIEHHLEGLSVAVAALHKGQQDALTAQEEILALLVELREMLDARLPKRRGRGQAGSA